MIVVDHVCTYFALLRAMQPNSKIETQNSNLYIQFTLKRNFTFDQLIDKNVHVPDNGHSARVIARFLTRDARYLGWVGNRRAGMV